MQHPSSFALAAEATEPPVGVLLVDDQPANLLALEAVLGDLGHTLVRAGSGEEALRLLRDRDFAVVLLDVRMPGMDGFQTARHLRRGERSRHTPVIFLTAAEESRSSLEEAYSLGAVDYLVKPLVPVIVRAKVAAFVDLFRQTERARRQADQFRLLIQGTTDYAIFLLDPGGRVATWNTGAERIKGYRAEEILGQHFSRFYLREDLDRGWPAEELRRAAAEGRVEHEGWRVRKDGSRFWANVLLTALRDEAGTLKGFSKVTRDITERKRAEEKVAAFAEQLQRSNRELERFASVASHDLQEPLRKVQAFGDRLQAKCGETLGEQGRDYLARMQASAARMRTLIDDLLTFSRVTSSARPFLPVDLGQVVRDVVSDLEGRIQQTGGQVEVGELPTLDADPVQVRQLLQNLLGNALKFHRPGEPPAVRVEGKLLPCGGPRASGEGPGGPLCEITVRDHGIGFEEKYLDRIFEVFQRLHGRTEYEGTGIGLAICRKVVERHGGTITARSTPGHGAAFIVTLPLHHAGEETDHG
jgi:PAS domain S-box-containing protein